VNWPKVIYVCPRCDRVQPPGRMGCNGAHEDAHPYERTVRVEVVPVVGEVIERDRIIEALRDGHRNDSAAEQVEFVSDLVGWSAEGDPEL
jgi:hypothetical protein